MKILLVEDHAALAEMSCRLLRDVHNHEVEHAATGAAALAVLPSFAPDIVLIDLHLPDTTGHDLAGRMRQNQPNAGLILIALTGFGGIVDETTARAAGFDAVFRKPMDFEILPTLTRRTEG